MIKEWNKKYTSSKEFPYSNIIPRLKLELIKNSCEVCFLAMSKRGYIRTLLMKYFTFLHKK